MPRSVLSDPIAAGINTFATVTDILSKAEDRKMKREIMSREILEHDLRMKKGQLELEEMQKAAAARNALKDHVGTASDEVLDSILGFPSVAAKTAQAAKEGGEPSYTPQDADAVVTAGVYSPVIPDNIDEIPRKAAATNNLLNFMNEVGPQVQVGKWRLDADSYPHFIDDVNTVFGDKVNEGSDANGHTVADHGVQKTIKGVFLDTTAKPYPTFSFLLDVKTPVTDGMVYDHIGSKEPQYLGTDYVKSGTLPEGMEAEGNIDLSQRKVRLNKDASGRVSISTLLSRSFEIDGQQVLLPLISPEGKKRMPREAIDAYLKPGPERGKHLGIFDTPENATEYALALHDDTIWDADKEAQTDKSGKDFTSYEAPRTFGATGDQNATIAQIPVPLMAQQLKDARQWYRTFMKLYANAKPEEVGKLWTARMEQRETDRAMMDAFSSVPKNLSGQARYDWLMSHKPSSIAPDKWATIIKPVEKTSSLTSPAGKTISDRARLVATYGEGSDQVKAFDQAAGSGKKGTTKTIYGPKGATKEVFIENGQDYTPPAGWTLQKPSDEALGGTKIGATKERLVGKVARGEKLTDGEQQAWDQITDVDNDTAKEAMQYLLKSDEIDKNQTPDEQVQKIRDTIAIFKAGKTGRGEIPKLKPITKTVFDEIATKFKDMKNGSQKRERMEEEAHSRGYDTVDRETDTSIFADFEEPESTATGRLVSGLTGLASKLGFKGEAADSTQGGAGTQPKLKPITRAIVDQVKDNLKKAGKALTKEAAEREARRLGYDPDVMEGEPKAGTRRPVPEF